jgi:hypothetical protein
MIGQLRLLDDLEGGSAAGVGMVNEQIQTIAAYLTGGRTTSPAVRQRLILANAQFNQLAGWMAFDAERHQTAQRYYRAGLSAARDTDHPELSAHILSCMSYQAVHCGKLGEATELADAAVSAAKDAHPLMKSLSMARLAHARAALGDEPGFRYATAETMALFSQAASASDRPDYLYWFDSPSNVHTMAGHSAVTPSNVTSRPRDALFHAAWLARAHVRHGDLQRAVSIADTALHHRGSVRSPRTFTVLKGLEQDLTTHREGRASSEVRELHRRLRELRSSSR